MGRERFESGEETVPGGRRQFAALRERVSGSESGHATRRR
jgi:hypothetical protein